MATQRRNATERIETLRQRQEQLKKQLATLESRQKQDERKRDARRKIVVGAAVLAHAELNPSFRDSLRDALQAAVTRDIDKAVIADLLGSNVPSPSPSPKPDETLPAHSPAGPSTSAHAVS